MLSPKIGSLISRPMEPKSVGRPRKNALQNMKRGRQSEPEPSASRDTEIRTRRSAVPASRSNDSVSPPPRKRQSTSQHQETSVSKESSATSTEISHRNSLSRRDIKRRRYFKGQTYSLGGKKKKNKPKSKGRSGAADDVESESTQESYTEGESAAEGFVSGTGGETSCDGKETHVDQDEDEDDCIQESDEDEIPVEDDDIEGYEDEEQDEVKLEIPEEDEDDENNELFSEKLEDLKNDDHLGDVDDKDGIEKLESDHDDTDDETNDDRPSSNGSVENKDDNTNIGKVQVESDVEKEEIVKSDTNVENSNVNGDDGNSILSSVKTRNRVKRRYDENLVDIDDPTFVEATEDASNASTGELIRSTRSSQVPPVSSTDATALVPYYPQESSIVPSNMKIEHLVDRSVPVYRCLCLSLPLSHPPPPTAGNDLHCQALDSVTGRIIGCSKKIKCSDMYRASHKVPYTALCEGHIIRHLSHQCCPTCGLFCTQGDFLLCKKGEGRTLQRHFFHKACAFRPNALETVGGVTNICPHCGDSDTIRSVKLEVECEATALVSFSQKISSTGPRAKISMGSSRFSNEDIQRPAILLPGMKEPKDPEGEEVEIMINGNTLLTCNTGWCPHVSRVTEAARSFNKTMAMKISPKMFYNGAKNGDIERVVFGIMSGVDICTVFTEEESFTALHIAAEKGHVDICHILIRAGCSVDALDSGLYTPFMVAIAAGRDKTARCLIAMGTDTAKCGEDGMTCLHLASKAGLLSVVQIILKKSSSQVNAQDEGGWTPIVWASEHQHTNVVLLLLKHGANPNIKDAEGNTALHWSAYSGTVDISLMYIDLGSDVNATNELGDTPLHVAARQDKYEMVMLLLGREADVSALNEASQKAIDVVKDKSSPCYHAILLSTEIKKAIKTSRRIKPMPRIIHRDISRGKEKHSIRVVNELDDDRTIPNDFMYLTNNCETSLLNIDTTIQSLQSCKCQDDCTSASCQCTQLGNGCWYRDRRLVENFNFKDPPIIFECNRACACFTNCENRVLQNGIKVHLELFKTELTGWGVRALQDIPRGTFVCEYVGEIITDKEADQREDDSYLFDLENRDGDTYCLDARHYGNVSRFINHCCDANVHPVRIYVDHHDLRFPRIALFATRDIVAGEQLGFDYGEKFWVIKYKHFLCGCGSPKCKYNSENINKALDAYHRKNATDEESCINGE